MSFSKSLSTVLRSTFGISTSWQSWEERIVLAALALGAGLLIYPGTTFSAAWQVGLWTAYLIILTVLIRFAKFKLFGPVLFYDMIRSARRSRYFILRCLYSGLLLVMLLMVFTPAIAFGGLTQRAASSVAMSFFEVFMLVQLIMVVLLTPAYVAGAISEEKDRRTLEYLLATDLYNREIVFSKLFARLANLSLLLLTGLPVLSFLQFLGGVDPNLVLMGFAVTGLSMLGIGSVSILSSVYFKRPRDSIVITYLILVAYHGLATTLLMMSFARRGGIFPFFDWYIWPVSLLGIDLGLPTLGAPPTIGDVSQFLNWGNLIAVVFKVFMAGNSGAPLATALPNILSEFAIFNGIVAFLCVGRSILRVRAEALKQTFGRTEKAGLRHRFRPAVTERPMMWKELNVEGTTKANWATWIISLVLMVLTLFTCPALWYVFGQLELFGIRNFSQNDVAEGMNIWVRIAGAGVACLTLLGVAVRASTTISVERDRDTFDALVATPMSANQILGAKFLGAIGSVRGGWFWLGMIWGLALLTDGLHPFAVPIMVGAWLIYACFFTLIGLWYSMVCKTSLRATIYTVLTTVAVSVGHWLLTAMFGCFYSLLIRFNANTDRVMEYIMKFQAGHTPPFVLGFLPYSDRDLAHNFTRDEFAELYGFSLFGLFLWAMACLLMWFVFIVPKFRQIASRNQTSFEEE